MPLANNISMPSNLLSLPHEVLLLIEKQLITWTPEDRYPEDTAYQTMLRLSQTHPSLKARRQHLDWQ